MPVAAAIGGAALIGGGASVYSANKAASAQTKAANQAAQIQKDQYAQTRADLMPYQQAGSTALSQYGNLLGQNGKEAQASSLKNYTESPFLSQLVQRTGNAVDASHAARGGLFSGGTAQEIGDRTGQLYLGDFNNYLSRIGGLADQGQAAAGQTGQLGANAAAGQANAYTAAGNAKAGGYINSANAIGNALGQGAQLYGAYKGGAFNTPPANYGYGAGQSVYGMN